MPFNNILWHGAVTLITDFNLESLNSARTINNKDLTDASRLIFGTIIPIAIIIDITLTTYKKIIVKYCTPTPEDDAFEKTNKIIKNTRSFYIILASFMAIIIFFFFLKNYGKIRADNHIKRQIECMFCDYWYSKIYLRENKEQNTDSIITEGLKRGEYKTIYQGNGMVYLISCKSAHRFDKDRKYYRENIDEVHIPSIAIPLRNISGLYRFPTAERSFKENVCGKSDQFKISYAETKKSTTTERSIDSGEPHTHENK
ncbi:MAG: hypothetical protein HQL81_11285 [Magnetococcales bacterium]|nr:hypothetical protein [Magnetococcales bacterium]